MTQDFVMGQLRMALTALIAFAGGKGWLTPTDSNLVIAFLTAIGPIFAPWIWSIVVNINTKRAPQQAVVIDPVMTPANADKKTATVQTFDGPITGKIVSVLLIAFALSFLVAVPSAMAAGKSTSGLPCDPAGLLPGCGASGGGLSGSSTALDNIATILAKPFTDIANFIGADADAAVALSTAIPNLQDGHGQQCWIAMQSFGAVVKAHPVPVTFHVINDYESLRLLGMATNNLCSNVHCTQVFADFTAMAQAASPVPLAIPSLHDLCTKVPQIAVVAPVTVTAAPTPAPTTTTTTTP